MIKRLVNAIDPAAARAALFDLGGCGCGVAAAFTWTTTAGLVALAVVLPLLGWRFEK